MERLTRVTIGWEGRQIEFMRMVAAEEKCTEQELFERWVQTGLEELLEAKYESGMTNPFEFEESVQSIAAEEQPEDLEPDSRILLRTILRGQLAQAMKRRRRAGLG